MLLEEFEQIKTPEIYEIILKYRKILPTNLSLKLNKNKMLPHRAISEQVSCFQKSKRKLPSFVDKSLLFDKIALEQSSSEFTAKYKSSLISGNKLIDLTGGLGIDDIFFANSFNRITYCELNKVISQIFSYNLDVLRLKNIGIINNDSIEILRSQDDNSFDWIYIDPARRDENRRSVDLEYCAPNVYDNMELFFQKSRNVMIKVAPAFDLTEAIRRFENLAEIHVISVDGECKEVLLLLEKSANNLAPKVFSITLNSKNEQKFILNDRFSKIREKPISELNQYFYEPDCAVIKSKLTPLLAKNLGLSFINNGSPFLTSSKLVNDFPGRSFKVVTSMNFNEKEIKKYLKQNGILKANIARRDFRLSVVEIRKMLKLKDGGDIYLFFTSDLNRRNTMIVTKKIS
jgi:THUMP domain-like